MVGVDTTSADTHTRDVDSSSEDSELVIAEGLEEAVASDTVIGDSEAVIETVHKGE